MWKKQDQDDVVGAHPEFAPKQTPDLDSPGNAPIESLMDSRLNRGNLAVGPQKVFAQDHNQPASSRTMMTYTEALNEFTTSATALIEQLPLLTKARDAYERAIRAGAELRKVLDTGEENLQNLMDQLEQAVNVRGGNFAPDRKKPEPEKVEAIRAADESRGGVKRTP
jgi:exonuclease VII small subunit